jgi:pimeloyl-ACP methyl ester carboxylesterase
MPSRSSLLAKLPPLLGLAALIVLALGGAQTLAAPGPSLAALRAEGAAEIQDVFVRTPRSIRDDQPLQALIALHGLNGDGDDFGGALATQADANGWLIVAPTIRYGDWTDPAQIVHEDPALVAWLTDYVGHLADRTGVAVQPRVLVFGHSRGAQLALRFTEMHPTQVAGVAALSAGTYTLPFTRDARTGRTLPFPFGVADLARSNGGEAFDAEQFDAVPIWIGVGARDNNDDVPHAWDEYIGRDRLHRARTFTKALQNLGADVVLTEFPSAANALTEDMRTAGCAALASAQNASPG